jgi:hypothetical protein
MSPLAIASLPRARADVLGRSTEDDAVEAP